MLLFVSDLHLTDDPNRTSVPAAELQLAIDEQIVRAEAYDFRAPTLVLLGDIFEILKSDVWLERRVRPWHSVDDNLRHACTDIIKRIIKVNRAFIDFLRARVDEKRLRLHYVPGNHDGVLARPFGQDARAALRAELRVQGQNGGPFHDYFPEEYYGVIARHGHEMDDYNRKRDDTPLVPGDAVVIDLLTLLPRKMANALGDVGGNQFHDDLRFVHELDNVRPHEPKLLAAWLQANLDAQLDAASRKRLSTALGTALSECLKGIYEVMRQYPDQSSLLKGFIRPLLYLAPVKGGRAFDHSLAWFARRIKGEKAAVMAHLHARTDDHAQVLFQMNPYLNDANSPYDLFVYGHTHYPTDRVIARSDGRRFTSVNTGTWRRVHAPVDGFLPKVQFRTYNEKTLLCVFPRDKENRPRDCARFEVIRRVSA